MKQIIERNTYTSNLKIIIHGWPMINFQFIYFSDAFDLQMGVAILRVQEGFTVDDNVEYAKKEEERRNKYGLYSL